MRVILLSVLIAMPALAQPSEIGWDQVERLRGAAGSCHDDSMRGTGHHVPDPHRELVHLLDNMLEIDPALCPGVPEAAAAALPGLLGEPERGGVDLALLALAWRAADQGQGMAPDPGLADLYGRMLWLLADEPPPLLRWTEPERAAWLVRPETVAMLHARNAMAYEATERSLTLEAELRLRRDLPYYDAGRAIDLLENGRASSELEARLRVSRMLTDGALVPPDFLRAANMFLWSVSLLRGYPEYQGELLRIGRLASASARTPAEQAVALHILFAASLNNLEGSREAGADLLRRIGTVRTASLVGKDAANIRAELNDELAFGIPLDDDPPNIRPIVLRGLIGPGGRLVHAEILRSSGPWFRDRAALGGWSAWRSVDLAATAQGRLSGSSSADRFPARLSRSSSS
jgi:hypothetical protein